MRLVWAILPLVIFSIVGISESFEAFIGSPKHQLESGVLPEDITCRQDRILVLRTNGDPACVKPKTAEKLIERGWTILSVDRVEKVWVEFLGAGQCYIDPWLNEWRKLNPDIGSLKWPEEHLEILKNYYQKHGITIFDSRVEPIKLPEIVSAACGGNTPTFYVLVNESVSDKVVDLGRPIPYQ